MCVCLVVIRLGLRSHKRHSERALDATAAGAASSEFVIGEVPGSKPRQLHREVHGAVDKMSTRDIRGGYAGWVPDKDRNRSEYYNTNFVADIHGAQADSIPRFRSGRQLDPLNPRYVLLDATTYVCCLIDCLFVCLLLIAVRCMFLRFC